MGIDLDMIHLAIIFSVGTPRTFAGDTLENVGVMHAYTPTITAIIHTDSQHKQPNYHHIQYCNDQ
jgi:hypothetical protein